MKLATLLLFAAFGGSMAQLRTQFATHSTVVPDNTDISDWIDADFDYEGSICGVFRDQETTYTCGSYYLACCNGLSSSAECALTSVGLSSSQCDKDYPYVGCCVVPNHSKDECSVLANGKTCKSNEYAVCFEDDDDGGDMYVLVDGGSGGDLQKTTCVNGGTPYCCGP